MPLGRNYEHVFANDWDLNTSEVFSHLELWREGKETMSGAKDAVFGSKPAGSVKGKRNSRMGSTCVCFHLQRPQFRPDES